MTTLTYLAVLPFGTFLFCFVCFSCCTYNLTYCNQQFIAQGKNPTITFHFFFQGIATSLGILADIFSSMNEKDYVRFKTNAAINLVRLLVCFFVSADSSDKLYVIVSNSTIFFSSSSFSSLLRGLKQIPLFPLEMFISTQIENCLAPGKRKQE